MKLKLGGNPVAKPAPTTLAEKTSGHKFTLPNQSKPTQTDSPEVAEKPKAGLSLGSKPVAETATESKVETAKPGVKDNAVPEVSDEKFNIVAGVDATLDTEAGNKFREMLTMLADNIDSDGDLQRILKGTMEYLRDNPECDAILKPEDRAIFVRAARKSYGITLAAKTTRKAKTTKSAAKVDELMDELADLDFAL